MGIAPSIPRDAVDYAWRARASCTSNDVASMSGYLAWGLPIRFLRDKLCPLGWLIGREGNFEAVISPDGSKVITAAAGNSHTGDPFRMPATRTDKGPETKVHVEATRQLSLLDEEASKPPRVETWFLLQYHDLRRAEIRSELSRGTAFQPINEEGDRGRVSQFSPRIYLEPIDLKHRLPLAHKQEISDEQIDIPVKRRTA